MIEGEVGVGVLAEKLCEWELPNATLETSPQPSRHYIALPIVLNIAVSFAQWPHGPHRVKRSLQ
jgi:hypothetical protein